MSLTSLIAEYKNLRQDSEHGTALEQKDVSGMGSFFDTKYAYKSCFDRVLQEFSKSRDLDAARGLEAFVLEHVSKAQMLRNEG